LSISLLKKRNRAALYYWQSAVQGAGYTITRPGRPAAIKIIAVSQMAVWVNIPIKRLDDHPQCVMLFMIFQIQSLNRGQVATC